MARGRLWQYFSFEGDRATEGFGALEGETQSDLCLFVNMAQASMPREGGGQERQQPDKGGGVGVGGKVKKAGRALSMDIEMGPPYQTDS